MFWLRDRRVPADGGTRIGWIARLGRALVRWLTPRSAIDGNPRDEDPPTRYANPTETSGSQSSPPFHAQPNGGLSADKAAASARVDAPPPTAESTGPERDDADVGRPNPSAQAAPVASEIPDEIAPAPSGPLQGDSLLPEATPSSPAELVEPANEAADQDREVDQEASETAIEDGEPSTQSPPISTAHADDPKLEPIEDPPAGSIDDPLPAPPFDTEEGTNGASAIAPLPNIGGDLDDLQPVHETEDACSQRAAESTDRGLKTDREGSTKQSVRRHERGSPDGPSTIPRYRPRLRPPPVQAQSRTAAPSPGSPNSPPGTLEAMYLISFLPGGWGLSVSVLLGRVDGMPENLNIRAGGDSFLLYAIDESLFEPIQPSNDNLIAEGFIAETEGDPVRRWVRSARDLHAFSQRPGVSGFASVPRVLIGQENVVLCRSAVAATVQQCASATGSELLVEVRGPGIPDGWHCFRGYWPRQPADFVGLDEIFLALNPHPDASIQFSGGVASARGRWVLGAPPVVRVLGVVPGPGELTIDGNPATASSDQGWIASGWDALGTHTVRFAGLSRTYEIAQIEEDWPSWATADEAAFSVCGARVSAETGVQALAITGGPYWLVGASAGDLVLARRSIRGVSIAAPSFQPVWALPPIGSGRQSSAIALAHRIPPRPPTATCSRNEIILWCQLLRAAGAPPGSSEKTLWHEYRSLARSLRRKWR